MSETEFMGDGFSVAIPGSANDGGLTAHRGVLHPDEYIDADALRVAVEESLGFTYEDVSSVYARGGRKTVEQRQLREKIDSRLLALSRSGANMTVAAKALGLGTTTVDRALVRARAVEVLPIVKAPAVTSRRVSFITGEEGATPRRRRHLGCPSSMLPLDGLRVSYINLTDAEYAAGLDPKPGNPAYWEFRAKAGA